MIKYSKSFLAKLEEIFAESDYVLRYEKGTFKSGYCIVKDTKVVLVNNYFPLDGKINILIDILKQLNLDRSRLGAKQLQLLHALHSNQPSTLFDEEVG